MITITLCGEQKIIIEAGKSLSEALKENGIFLLAPCGSFGRCGKCRIRVIEGTLPITDEDRRYLKASELKAGIRLACRAYPTEDITIELPEDANSIKCLAVMQMDTEMDSEDNADEVSEEIKGRHYGVALDIGTTTLAACLVDITSKRVVDTITAVNSQGCYGADVVSRINASNEGREADLKQLIAGDIKRLISSLNERNSISFSDVEKVVIAANTTMVHLLMGYSCAGLGVYPFKPITLETVRIKAGELFGVDEWDAMVIILPGISAYVGGDIVSGLLLLDADLRSDVFAFADLGTNAEMVIGNKGEMFATSAAAGPAFEGGNLSCGIPAVRGAICSADIDINNKTAVVKTIGDYPAEGLCGSGAVEIMSELLDKGIVDVTGLMSTDFENGYLLAHKKNDKDIVFTQEDVRKIQLAKGAIRAGFETLLDKAGVDGKSLNAVFLAGGFGYYLNVDKAVNIGLFPKEAGNVLSAVGNTSLAGAAKYMILPDGDERVCAIVSRTQEVSLATDDGFNRRFINAMTF